MATGNTFMTASKVRYTCHQKMTRSAMGPIRNEANNHPERLTSARLIGDRKLIQDNVL